METEGTAVNLSLLFAARSHAPREIDSRSIQKTCNDEYYITGPDYVHQSRYIICPVKSCKGEQERIEEL